MKKTATRISWKLYDLAFVTLSIFCILAGLYILLRLVKGTLHIDDPAYSGVVTFVLISIQSAAIFVPLYFSIIKKYSLDFSALGLVPVHLKETALNLLKAFGMLCAFNIILVLVMGAIDHEIPGFQGQDSYRELLGTTRVEMLLTFAAFTIIAPLIEEIFFRGFLLQSLVQWLGTRTGSIVTAAFFSLVHLQPQSAGIIFVLGLILNWLYLRSHSILPTFLFHFLNNLLALLLSLLV